MKKAWRKIIAACNSLINIAVMVFLVLLLIIGCYAIWDTKLVHTQASGSHWKAYKPTSNNVLSYDELREINSDVIGWVTIYGTGIDYPVMHSSVDTDYYLFRDPTGKPSIIGSIFMDTNCSSDFSDYKSILYGHHMDSHVMLGDLDLFDKQDFFTDHTYGNLFYNNTNHGLRIFSYIKTTSRDSVIYNFGINSEAGKIQHLSSIRDKSLYWRDTSYYPSQRLLVLSTCSTAETEARTVVVAEITDETYEDIFKTDDGYSWPGVEDLEGWLGFPWAGWFVALIVIVMIVAYILWQADKKKKEKKKVQDIPEINKYGTY